MTLEHLVVYGGIILGIWLVGVLTLLIAPHQHRSVLHDDARRGAQRIEEGRRLGIWASRLRRALGHR